MIGKGRRFQDLYILDLHNLATSSSSLPVNQVSFPIHHVSATTWHHRLGHLSFKRLSLIQSQLPCIVSKCNNVQPCYICPLAKHRCLSFPSNNHMSKFPFDLVHCDVWGPYNVSAMFGYRYFLTIVDDCTRFTWIYLLKQKSDAIVAIPQFFNMISNQFNSTIKVFRSDNAKELAFTDFFNEKGVLHQYSCVETP